MAIGSPVYVYNFSLSEKNRYRDGKPYFSVRQHTVIGENDKRLVIDDSVFSTIEKVKDKNSWDTVIGVPRTHIYINDSIFGTGIRYTLYSYEKVKAKQIKETINRAIKSKLKFFSTDIDLSVINDKVINDDLKSE